MTKESWCTVTPTSGQENDTLNISATPFDGRLARNTTVTIQAQNGSKPSKDIVVTQTGKGVVFTLTTASHPDLPKEGGMITLTGTSNCEKIIWGIVGRLPNGQSINIPSTTLTCKVKDTTIQSDAAIPGDPGASGIYTYTLTGNFVNKAARDLRMSIAITGRAGEMGDDIRIFAPEFIAKGSASTLSVDKNSVSLPVDGTAQNVEVTSNDTWEVS